IEDMDSLSWHTDPGEIDWNRVRQCRPILSKFSEDTLSLFKMSDEIRRSPASSKLGLDQFDSYNILSTQINESKVKTALVMSSKKHEAILRSSSAKNKEDGFWSFFCQYNEAYKNSDKISAAEPNRYRRQKLKNEKEQM